MPTAPEPVTASFRFSTDMLARLGEELNPEIDQGLLELVRNAWDEDAPSCRVSLNDVTEPGGTVVVSDDGVGMSADEIVDGWLVLGRSGKSKARTSPGGRLVIGDKGLGRLAALRLGQEAVLRTRPAGQGVEHTVVCRGTGSVRPRSLRRSPS